MHNDHSARRGRDVSNNSSRSQAILSRGSVIEVLESRRLLASALTANASLDPVRSAAKAVVVDLAFSEPVKANAATASNYTLKTVTGKTINPSKLKFSSDRRVLSIDFPEGTPVAGASLRVKGPAVQSTSGVKLAAKDAFLPVMSLASFGTGTSSPLASSINQTAADLQAADVVRPGSIAVVRVGAGSASLSNAAQAVFIDQYAVDSDGNISTTPTSSIPLPTADAGGNQMLTLSGTATSEGQLNRSADGKYLVLAGYDATVGTAAVASTASATVNRVIARVDVSTGGVDTSTRFGNAFTGNNVRSVASEDGMGFWVAGSTTGGIGFGGVFYESLGGSTATQVFSSKTAGAGNVRTVNTFNGQLYASAASTTSTFGIATIGTGLPTTSGQTIADLPGFPTASGHGMYDPWFADADNILVADDSTANKGVQHWRRTAGTWTRVATMISSGDSAYRSVTATKNPVDGSWLVFATSNAGVQAFRYDPVGLTYVQLNQLSAPANTVFRGVEIFTDPAALGLALVPGSDTGVSQIDRITSDTTPTFNVGVNRPGTVSLDWTGDGVADLQQVVTSTSGGIIALTPATALPDGSYTVVAKFSTADGADVTQAISIEIDSTPPEVSSFTLIDQEGPEWKARVVFGGDELDLATADASDFVISGPSGYVPTPVSFNGLDLSFPAFDLTGAYSITVGPDVRDVAGNSMSEAYTFELAISPIPSVAIDLQASSDSGAASNDNITNDNTPTFDISVNGPGVLGLDWTGDGVADSSLTVAAAGTYSLTTAALADASPQRITALFAPTAGAIVSSAVDVVIDTRGPVFGFQGSALNSGQIVFAFLADEDVVQSSLGVSDFSAQLSAIPSGTPLPVLNVAVPGGSFGSAVTRQVFFVTQDPGIAGNYLYVVGPAISDVAGNAMFEALTGQTPIGEFLTVTTSSSSTTETAGAGALVGTVSRSGDTTSPLTVQLATDATELSIPASVVIAAGQASATFDIATIDDGVADGDQFVTITATALNYTSGQSAPITVADETAPALSLSLPPALREGDAATTGRVTRNTPTDSDLTVTLSVDAPGQITVPVTVVIPSGSAFADFSLQAIDDAIGESPAVVSISAAASGHAGASANVSVRDGIPTVTSFAFSRQQQQLSVAFSEDVSASLSAADAQLRGRTGAGLADVQLVLQGYDVSTNVARFSFTGTSGTSPNLLVQGRYQFKLISAGVTDAIGNTLDGDGNGTAGDDFTARSFNFLYDPDGDGYVSIADQTRYRSNIGKTNPTFDDGDVNYDGVINSADLRLLVLNSTRASAAYKVVAKWQFLYDTEETFLASLA